MKIYEIIILFNYKKKNLIKFISYIKNFIIYNSIFLNLENWGKKKLCFKIKNKKKAIFLVLRFKSNYDTYIKIIDYLRINSFFILRFFSNFLKSNINYLNNFLFYKISKRNTFKKLKKNVFKKKNK